jgi:integrase
MPPTRKPTPSYLPHKRSGRGRAVWTDAAGVRHQQLLPGPFGSFARLVAELVVSPSAPTRADADGLTVNELLLAFAEYAEKQDRTPDGPPTDEVKHLRIVSRYVRGLYGDTPAAAFGPLALKVVRQQFVGAGWCRETVNQQTERARRIFKWAASEVLVPVTVYRALAAVDGLRRGRTDAWESEPVGPVDDDHVDAVLPYLNRQVRGLVEFQRLTGCRPGEACRVRRAEIDTGGPVWLYRPPHHKTAWRGKARVIAIGPKAQDLIREFFTPNLDDYLFSPRRAREERYAAMRAARKNNVPPSQRDRRKANPKRKPAGRYDVSPYDHAITTACGKAGVPLWRPNQLRHTFATRVRKEHGPEAVQVLLGHSKADVTQIYAEKNEALAVGIAAKIGRCDRMFTNRLRADPPRAGPGAGLLAWPPRGPVPGSHTRGHVMPDSPNDSMQYPSIPYRAGPCAADLANAGSAARRLAELRPGRPG